MAEAFDPYYKWLGIPPKDQPPNHYRLLAIEAFEPDIEVIDTAANRQMAFVQEFSTGPHLAASQKLLNEIAAARIKLLNKQGKVEYDRELRARLTIEAASSTDDNSATPPAGVPIVQAGDTDAEPFVSIDLAGTGKGAKPTRGPTTSSGSKALPKGKKLSKSASGRPGIKGKESSLAQRRKSNELSTQAKMIFGGIFVLAVCGVGALAYQMSRPKAEPASTATVPTPKFASPTTPASPPTASSTTKSPTTPLPKTVALPKATQPAAPAKSSFLDRAGPAQSATKTPATKKPSTTAKTPAKTRKTAKTAAKAAEDERNAQVAKYLEAVKAARDKADADKKAAEEKKDNEKKSADAAKAKPNESPEPSAPATDSKSSSEKPADKPAESSGKSSP